MSFSFIWYICHQDANGFTPSTIQVTQHIILVPPIVHFPAIRKPIEKQCNESSEVCKFVVRCIGFEKGWAWTGELSDLRTHIEKYRCNMQRKEQGQQ